MSFLNSGNKIMKLVFLKMLCKIFLQIETAVIFYIAITWIISESNEISLPSPLTITLLIAGVFLASYGKYWIEAKIEEEKRES